MTETTANNYWKFWGTLLWGILVAAVFVVAQTTVALLMMSGMSPEEMDTFALTADTNGALITLATFATTVVGSLLILAIIKIKRGATIKHYLALNPVPAREVLKWFGGLVVIIVLADLAMYLLGRPIIPEFMVKAYSSADSLWMLWLAIIIGAPLFEELFFRGFLMQGLQHSFLKPVGAIIVTTALWAVIHHQYDIYGIIIVFILGLVLGYARIKSGSLILPITMHLFVNAVATVQVSIMLSLQQ